MDKTWIVKIIETETGIIEKEFSYNSERQAEKAERGVNRNLNHDKFHTEIEERE